MNTYSVSRIYWSLEPRTRTRALYTGETRLENRQLHTVHCSTLGRWPLVLGAVLPYSRVRRISVRRDYLIHRRRCMRSPSPLSRLVASTAQPRSRCIRPDSTYGQYVVCHTRPSATVLPQ